MVTVTHAFNVKIADNPTAAAAGEVLPSHWNANHVVTGVRTALTAATTFHIATTGSDSTGDGLTSGTAWATLQHAWDFIASNYDTAGFLVTIQLADGTYAGFHAFNGPSGSSQFLFKGNAADSTKVVLQDTWSGAFAVIDIQTSSVVVLQFNNITFSVLTNGNSALEVDSNGSSIYASNCRFISTAGAPGFGLSVNNAGGLIAVGFDNVNNVITGGEILGTWQSFILDGNALSFFVLIGTITLTSTPNWTLAFARLSWVGSSLQINGATFVGSATGKRFQILGPVGIGTEAPQNITSLPGSVAGTFDNAVGFYGGQTDWKAGAAKISGTPTTSNIPNDGTWGVYKDTSGGGVYLAYNDSGTIKSITGGSSGQLQYNNSGLFGGAAGTSWDNTNLALSITGSTNLTSSNPILNLSQTWASTGTTFTGVLLNISNTAAAAGSKLIDFQLAGSSILNAQSIANAGSTGVQLITAGNEFIVQQNGDSLGSSSFTVLNRSGSAGFLVTVNGISLADIVFNANGAAQQIIRLEARNSGAFAYSANSYEFQIAGVSASTSCKFAVGDVGVIAQIANFIVAQKTNPTAIRVYNTVDTAGSPTNYERGIFDWTVNSNVLTVGTQAGGTGTLRGMNLTAASLTCTSTAISFSGLPTANPHIAGQLWSNANVVTISTG